MIGRRSDSEQGVEVSFVDTGVTLQNTMDLILGGGFMLGSGVAFLVKSQECLEVISTLKDDPNDFVPCLVLGFFFAVGTFFFFNHWVERRRETLIVTEGSVTTGVVTSIEPQSDGGTYVAYEYRSSSGELLTGDFTFQGRRLTQGGEILILFDAVDPKKHRAVPTLCFYRAEQILSK